MKNKSDVDASMKNTNGKNLSKDRDYEPPPILLPNPHSY
jgi:hypothetical protein